MLHMLAMDRFFYLQPGFTFRNLLVNITESRLTDKFCLMPLQQISGSSPMRILARTGRLRNFE
jgi:hypothetical protein